MRDEARLMSGGTHQATAKIGKGKDKRKGKGKGLRDDDSGRRNNAVGSIVMSRDEPMCHPQEKGGASQERTSERTNEEWGLRRSAEGWEGTCRGDSGLGPTATPGRIINGVRNASTF